MVILLCKTQRMKTWNILSRHVSKAVQPSHHLSDSYSILDGSHFYISSHVYMDGSDEKASAYNAIYLYRKLSSNAVQPSHARYCCLLEATIIGGCIIDGGE